MTVATPTLTPHPTPDDLTPERHAALVAVAVLAAALLTWVDGLTLLAYPFRLLLTLVHELSHGFAALATGGRFVRFVVFADGSGLAYTAGGWRWLVIPAGYLGAAAFGAGLLVAGGSVRGGRWALGAVGAVVFLATLRYSLPTLASRQAAGGALTLVAGLALGALLFGLAGRAGAGWIVFAVHLLAVMAALTAFSDLWTLIGLSAGGSGVDCDAEAMAAATFLPAVVWAVVWALAASLLVGAAARHAWRRWS